MSGRDSEGSNIETPDGPRSPDTHSLPAEEEELEQCAIRMGYSTEDQKKAVESFHVDHQRHTEIVHRTFQSLFLEPKTSPIFKAMLKTIGVQS